MLFVDSILVKGSVITLLHLQPIIFVLSAF